MAYLRSPILIGDNKREYLSHEPWIHGTFLMWAPHVWCCVTDFSSLTALLDYLVTNKIKAQSPSPDDKYQIILNSIKTCHEPLDCAYLTLHLIFDRCVVPRLCQQIRFIVPVESVGADRVPIVQIPIAQIPCTWQTTYSNSLRCMTLFYFNQNSFRICAQRSIEGYVRISLDNGLAMIRRQTIIWTNKWQLFIPFHEQWSPVYRMTYRLTLSVWIEIPQTLINRSRLHGNGNHSPRGLYSKLSEIHNFGAKLIIRTSTYLDD